MTERATTGSASEACERLAIAADETHPVASLTHNYYRYPARFSDRFAREAIASFTQPGDLVLDPFVGGGTTIVEALANGRRGIGTDISSLACFVTRVKTTPLSEENAEIVLCALERATSGAHEQQGLMDEAKRHLRAVPWRLARAIAHAREHFRRIDKPRPRDFAQSVLLRTAQWALDNRRVLPSVRAFHERMWSFAHEMLAANVDMRARLRAVGVTQRSLSASRLVLRRSAQTLADDKRIARFGDIQLVLTSPPYLGVHVLYHRWQVRGRKETGAPFWIAGVPDDRGGPSYTFVDRRSKSPHRYFEQVCMSFSAVARLLKPGVPLIQLVSFSRPDIHLKEYLEAIVSAGFEQCEAYSRSFGSYYWRDVPGRRWYNHLAGQTASTGREVLLIHRRKP